MEFREDYRNVYNTALSIMEQAIQAVIGCVGILNNNPDVGLRGFTEHLMAVHLRVIAGVCYGRSTFDYGPVEEPLLRVYELEPWKYGLFVREALYEVVTNTTLHPASFDALLQIIPQCKEEIRQSKARGSVAAPQEVTLLKKTLEGAWKYLHFSSEAENRDRNFREILDRWQANEDEEIRNLIVRIKTDFCD